MAICSKCGAHAGDGDKFCPECGNPIAAAPPVQAYPDAPANPQQPTYQQYQPYQQPYAPPQYSAGQQPSPYQQQPYQQGPYSQQGPWNAPPPPSGPTIGGVYARAFEMLKQKPIRLWGLSLMCSLLTALATAFGFIPIISLPIVFTLQLGMAAIYLDGIRGKEVSSDQLFAGFSRFFRSAGGIGWMYLWVLIWALIPIVGPIFAIIKAYSYRFVPYIMLGDPEVSGTEALRRSKAMTDGWKGRMFGADIIIMLIVWVVFLVFGLLSRIGGIGIVFAILLAIIAAVVAAVLPLLMGLIGAAFYDEIEKKK